MQLAGAPMAVLVCISLLSAAASLLLAFSSVQGTRHGANNRAKTCCTCEAMHGGSLLLGCAALAPMAVRALALGAAAGFEHPVHHALLRAHGVAHIQHARTSAAAGKSAVVAALAQQQLAVQLLQPGLLAACQCLQLVKPGALVPQGCLELPDLVLILLPGAPAEAQLSLAQVYSSLYS